MIENVLTNDAIQANANEFESLIRKINRDGAKIDKLLYKLENSDWYTAPASTEYHGAYPGGLVDHSLCVYHNLLSLIKTKQLTNISEESIIITALLHDLDKMNCYEQYVRNVPPSKEHPSWTKEESYRKIKNRDFRYGNHEQNSEYMVRQFIPLTIEESVAILHHMGGMAFDSSQVNIGQIYDKYPLAMFLHLADMLSAYIDKA